MAHVLADIRQSEAFGCIPHGARAWHEKVFFAMGSNPMVFPHGSKTQLNSSAMSTTLTPLRYPGGKSSYAALLSEIIRLNAMGKPIFVEPYAGGAGASIKLLLADKVAGLILNDLDPRIYAFWWAVKYHSKDLIELIRSKPVNLDEWYRQREISRKCSQKNLLNLGFSTLYLNRCNRSGILQANPIGGINQTGKYKIDARFNKDGIIQKIEKIAEKAESICVKNEMCERLIESLDCKKNSHFIYFDPPYYQKGPSLYMNHYLEKDHVELSKRIRRCKIPWVLSYDYNEEICRLYKGLPQYTSNIRYTILGNEKASELVVTKLLVPHNIKKL